MSVHRRALGLLIVAVLIGGAGCRRAEPALTPEQARAKGEELLRAMSTSLSSTQSFSFTADERREVAGAGGSKTERRDTRQVSVRRPNALTVTHKGDSRDGQSWYDGKQLTFVSTRQQGLGPRPDAAARWTRRWTSSPPNTPCRCRRPTCSTAIRTTR